MIHGWFNNHSIVFRFPFFMFSSVLRMPCYWNLGSLLWCLQEETPATAAQGPPRPPVGYLVCTRRSALWSSQGRGAQAAFVRVRAWVCSERYLTRHFRQNPLVPLRWREGCPRYQAETSTRRALEDGLLRAFLLLAAGHDLRQHGWVLHRVSISHYVSAPHPACFLGLN